MSQKISPEQLKSELRTELEKCVILPREEKEYWLSMLEKLPLQSIRNVLKIVKEKNEIVEKGLQAAADTEQKSLAELKSMIKKVKEGAFELEHKAEGKSAEEELDTMLKQV
jgi:hypothetical protein